MSDQKPSYEELERRCRRAEARLAAIETGNGDRYQHLFDNSHAVMLVIDPDSGDIRDANRAAADYYGWCRSELAAMNIGDLNTLSPQEIFAQLQAARKEMRSHFQFRHRRADGSVRDVEVHSGPVSVNGRSLLHSIIHDVTDRTEAEAALQNCTRELACLYDLARIVEQKGMPVGAILQEAVHLLRRACRHPESAAARIEWEGRVYESGDFGHCKPVLSRKLHLPEEMAGSMEIGYPPDEPGTPERSFPSEEHALINALAERLGRILERRQTREALQESEERFRLFMDRSPTLSWINDEQGRYLFLSQNHERYFGIPIEEWIGKQLQEVVPPETAAPFRQNDRRVLEEKRPMEFIERVVTPEGEDRTFQVQKIPFQSTGGRWYLGGIALDITERLRTEKKLRESEAHHRVIFEKSPLGMIRFSPEGTILDCNQRFIDLMGSSREKLIGFNTARQSTPEMRRTIQRALAGETAVFENEYTSVTGGKTLWLRVVFNPVTPGRSPTEVIATLEDVSERKTAEEALRKTESLLKEAQQIARIASYERNLETGQGWWSDEHYRLFGYEPGEVAHSFEFFLSHLHEEDRGRAENILRSAYDKMTPFSYDCRYIRKDGEMRHAHHTGIGVLSEDGKSKWLRGTFQDITERKQAEEALKKSEERYRTLLESVSDAVFVLDRDWNQIIINEAAAKFTGIAAEKLINDNLLTLFPGIELTPFFKTFKRAMEEREADVVESEYRFPDGRKGWYEVSVYPVPEGILCISRDITERKRIEEKLRKSEAKFRDIFNNSLWGIFQSTVEGQFLSCNAAFARTFGYDSPEDLIASITDISHQYYVDPEDRRRYIRLLEQNGVVENYEFKARRKDGSEIWVTNSTRVVRDEAGRLLYYEGTVNNITDRKHTEEVLKESEERFRRLFEASPFGIGFADVATSRLVKVNPMFCRIFGYTQGELQGLTIADLSYAEDIPENEALSRDALDGKASSFRVEKRYLKKNGDLIWCNLTGTLLYDVHGNPTYRIGILEDITEKKRSEQALRNSEARHRIIFEKSPLGMVRFAPDGIILDCNDPFVQLMGSSREKLIGFNMATQSTPEMCRTVKKALSGETATYEAEYTSVTGAKTSWLRAVFNPVNPGHPPTEVIAAMEDVTDRKWAEKRLKESEQKFSTAFMDSPAILTITTVEEGKYLEVNDAFTEFTGYSREEALGKTSLELDTWADPSLRSELITRFNRDGIVKNAEIQIKPKTGEKRIGLISTQTISIEGKDHFLTQIFDITDQRKTEAKLRESEERYRRLTENAQDIIWRTDSRGRLVFLNSAVKSLLGYAPQEVIGLGLSDYMDKNSVDRLLEKTNAIRLNETPDNHFRLEINYLAKTGEPVPFEINVVALKNAEGKIEGYEGISRDITERKQAEEALISSEARLKHLLQASPAVIYSCKSYGDFGATFISDNIHQVLGYTPQDIIGTENFWMDHLHPMDSPRIIADLSQLFENGRHLHEYRFLHKDGHYRWMLDQLQLLYNEDGKPLEIVGSWVDITDRKEMEEQLEKAKQAAEAASRAKSEFIANMSHELRTPLNAILGYGQILIRDETLSELHRQNIAVMKSSGEHLLTLINDILDIAKIEAGKLQLHAGSTDLKSLIANVLSMVRIRAVQKRIELIEEIDPALPRFVEADEKRLRQVLLNLLSNAVKFTQSGNATLRVRPADHAIAFSVTDTGMGIPEDQLKRIFEAFHQLGPIPGKTDGTGLGLTISQNLVKLMGGDIRVESRIGEGSAFRFQIPLVEASLEKAAEPDGAPEDPADWPATEEAAPTGPITPPPKEDIAALHAMSRIGDLSAIIEYVAKMRQSDPGTEAFCRAMETYAAECDMTAIRNLIQDFPGGDR